MAVFETWLKTDLQKPISVKQLPGVVFSQDSMANKVGVIVTDGGAPVELSGTVYGYVIKPDGTTVNIEGEIDEEDSSRAYFLMTQECYAVGHISIAIKIQDDDVITTLAACSAYVYQSRKGTEVVPSGTVIPDLATLTDLIADAEDATDAANDAADAATAVAESIEGAIAVPFDEDEANEAGTYVTKDGKMYFLPNGHEAEVPWANTTKVETNSGKELSDLKNAIDDITYGLMPKTVIPNKYVNGSGVYTTYNGWSIIDYIDISKYECVCIYSPVNTSYNTFYDNSKQKVSNFSVTDGMNYIKIPENAVYMAISNTSAAIAETEVYTVETSNIKMDALGVRNNLETDELTGVKNFISAKNTYYEQGINFTQNGGIIHCEGTAKANAYYRLYNNQSALPSFLVDRTMMVRYKGTSDITLTITEYYSSGQHSIVSAQSSYNGKVTLDPDAVGLMIRIDVPNGETVSADVVLIVYSTMTNSELTARVTENDLPNYYYENDWFPNKIQDITDNSAIINGQTFVFITDTHFNANSMHSKQMLKIVLDDTTVPFVICGGDYVGVYGSESDLIEQSYEIVKYQNYIGKDRFFSTRGNHDFYNRDGQGSENRWLTEGQAYDIICRNCERFVSEMFPEHMCYVIENPGQKTAILMINSKDASGATQTKITGEQAKWICDVLVKYQNWNIIAVSHIPADPYFTYAEQTQLIVHTILSTFNAKGIIDRNHSGTALYADFSNAEGYVWCHLCGHTHTDESHYADGVLSILTTSDAHYQDDGHGAEVGTVTEQAFDVFCIDYDAKTIYAVRVGRGTDRKWEYSEGAWTQVELT